MRILDIQANSQHSCKILVIFIKHQKLFSNSDAPVSIERLETKIIIEYAALFALKPGAKNLTPNIFTQPPPSTQASPTAPASTIPRGCCLGYVRERFGIIGMGLCVCMCLYVCVSS